MFCTKCGNEILEEEFFCGNCGKKLKEENLTNVQPDEAATSAPVSNIENNLTADILEHETEEEQNTTEVVATVPTGESYDKIGGFLVLLAIGLVIAPFTYVVDIGDTIKVINNGDFELFKDGFKNLMYFNVASSLFLLIYLFFLMFQFFHKKQSFPKYFSLYYVLNIATAIIIFISIDKIGLSNLMESKDLQDMSSSLFKSIFAAIIWIPYLFISKRAKGTFVN